MSVREQRSQQNNCVILKLLMLYPNWTYDTRKNVTRFPILSSFNLLFRSLLFTFFELATILWTEEACAS